MQPLRLRVSLHYSVSYIFRLFGSKETGRFSAVSLYAVFPCFTYFYKIKNATILYQSLRLDVANHSINDTMQPFFNLHSAALALDNLLRPFNVPQFLFIFFLCWNFLRSFRVLPFGTLLPHYFVLG